MDTRVEILLQELVALPRDRDIDFSYWRERFQSLLKVQLDIESRIALLTSYAAILDLVERTLQKMPEQLAKFKEARALDWRALCLDEALQRSDTDLLYPDDLNEIVTREVAAGRMFKSEYTNFLDDVAKTLPGNPKNRPPRASLWKRLLG